MRLRHGNREDDGVYPLGGRALTERASRCWHPFFGAYEVTCLSGPGGMGGVYRARDRKLETATMSV